MENMNQSPEAAARRMADIAERHFGLIARKSEESLADFCARCIGISPAQFAETLRLSMALFSGNEIKLGGKFHLGMLLVLGLTPSASLMIDKTRVTEAAREVGKKDGRIN